MNRGYAGFYKGFYLRSSYEFAYAKYLDFNLIPWSYEDKTFNLGYKIYKPDFFFYDKEGRLMKIVEIKSRNKEAKKNALLALDKVKELYGIDNELISYEELMDLYKSLPFTLNSVLMEWIYSENTTITKAAFGQLNGHFNLKHTPETKKKIGEHTKQLWSEDSPAKQKMLEGLRRSGLVQKGKVKTPREIRCCLNCNTKFEVLVTSAKKYCNRGCSGKDAIKIASEAYIDRRKNIHLEIKRYIISWSMLNKWIVIETPMNKIKTTIHPLVEEIYRNFGVKDFRVISAAVFGEDRGRKELINFMKSVCNEKIC